jgi:hypothetical protein
MPRHAVWFARVLLVGRQLLYVMCYVMLEYEIRYMEYGIAYDNDARRLHGVYEGGNTLDCPRRLGKEPLRLSSVRLTSWKLSPRNRRGSRRGKRRTRAGLTSHESMFMDINVLTGAEHNHLHACQGSRMDGSLERKALAGRRPSSKEGALLLPVDGLDEGDSR